MTKVLLIKELRETLGIALLALAAYVYFLPTVVGVGLTPLALGYDSIPFVSGAFLSFYVMVAGALALALGFRQSVAESYRGTYLLLLHRPMSRRQLIGMKLATGAAVYLACSVLPIAGYGWWAATPGTHASPFEWSMTVPAWKACFAMLLLYLGSFLSGLRPARWFGTRLAPAAAGGLLAGLVQVVPWWPVFVVALAALGGALVANILFVAQERDY